MKIFCQEIQFSCNECIVGAPVREPNACQLLLDLEEESNGAQVHLQWKDEEAWLQGSTCW